jgi:hypothetical protein
LFHGFPFCPPLAASTAAIGELESLGALPMMETAHDKCHDSADTCYDEDVEYYAHQTYYDKRAEIKFAF